MIADSERLWVSSTRLEEEREDGDEILRVYFDRTGQNRATRMQWMTARGTLVPMCGKPQKRTRRRHSGKTWYWSSVLKLGCAFWTCYQTVGEGDLVDLKCRMLDMLLIVLGKRRRICNLLFCLRCVLG